LLTHKKKNTIKRYFLVNEEIFEQFIKGEEQLSHVLEIGPSNVEF
jgi:hypothetical protein